VLSSLLDDLFDESISDSRVLAFANAEGIESFFLLGFHGKAVVSFMGACSFVVVLPSLSDDLLDESISDSRVLAFANAEGVESFFLLGFEGEAAVSLIGACSFVVVLSSLVVDLFDKSMSGSRPLGFEAANRLGITSFCFGLMGDFEGFTGIPSGITISTGF